MARVETVVLEASFQALGRTIAAELKLFRVEPQDHRLGVALEYQFILLEDSVVGLEAVEWLDDRAVLEAELVIVVVGEPKTMVLVLPPFEDAGYLSPGEQEQVALVSAFEHEEVRPSFEGVLVKGEVEDGVGPGLEH